MNTPSTERKNGLDPIEAKPWVPNTMTKHETDEKHHSKSNHLISLMIGSLVGITLVVLGILYFFGFLHH